MNYAFYGDDKIIEMPPGATIDVSLVDLWSRWIDWVALPGNMHFWKAFRFVGGDPTSDTKRLGVTFFLINGWRLRPHNTNTWIRFSGNIYTDPSGFSPFVSSLSGGNVVIEYTVSNLSDTIIQQGGVSGLSPTQATMLLEMYNLLGLDPTRPLIVSTTNRIAGEIAQTIDVNPTTKTTVVTRV